MSSLSPADEETLHKCSEESSNLLAAHLMMMWCVLDMMALENLTKAGLCIASLIDPRLVKDLLELTLYGFNKYLEG